MISNSTIDKVRDLSIVDVVGKYVDLKKSGANYRAPSPFTSEKTPSFYVVPAKQIFKCFSSGKGGDGIRFVMDKENVAYVDAIKILCSSFNVSIEYDSNGHSKEYYDELEELYRVNQAAANLYAKELLTVEGNHPAFLELINKRRFSPDTLLQWQIGYAPGEIESYAPSKWNFLSKTMITAGYYKQGIDLGLIKTKGDVNYDVFRNRIMYPIVDHHGRCVSFGARALKPDSYNAKYVNGSESKIYNKSTVLFGLHFAGKAIREKGFANLMEGYTDVIGFHQAGHINTVGTLGTALTVDQVKLLRQYTNKAVLIYDPDKAGQSAAARALAILTRHGFQCGVVPMPSIVALKREGNEQPWREMVFITQQTTEVLSIRTLTEERNIQMSQVEAIEKLDPDEIVRLF